LPTLGASRSLVRATLAHGDHVGRYIIQDRLGAGGMGVVHKAHDPDLNRSVALKLVRAVDENGQPDKGAKTRLLREAQALARLSHPNVVAVHDVGTFGDDVFIAMELVAGHTLKQWIEARPRTANEILCAMIDAGRGLSAAHEVGLIHRDFKPENVVVGEDGRVRVLDFGLARASDTDDLPGRRDSLRETGSSRSVLGRDLTQGGAIVGTLGYMAPEQLVGGEVDARADQFSFCVTLYRALAGVRPFSAVTANELLADIENRQLTEPTPDSLLSGRVARIVARGLASSPDDRYPSMDALLEALAQRPARRAKQAASVVAALSVVGLGALGWLQPPRREGALCTGAERKLAGVWDQQTKQALRSAFLATDRAHAQDTFERFARLLDAYAGAWVSQHRQACEATRVRGEQSEAVLDLRMRCLDRRLGELGKLAEVFRTVDDGATLDKAVPAAYLLRPLEECSDLEALQRAQPLPSHPDERRTLAQLESRLADIEALHTAGRFEPGLERVTALVEDADRLGYVPFQASARYELARMQRARGMYQVGEATYRQVIKESSRVGSDEIAAKSWIGLFDVLVSQARYAAAGDLRTAVEAALSRLEEGSELFPAYSLMVGKMYLALGQRAEARRELTRAVELWERARGSEHPNIAMALTGLGAVAQSEGDHEEALRHHARAQRILENALGPDHPEVAVAVHNAGVALYSQGKYAEAEAQYERTLQIEARSLGPEHPEVALTLNNLGTVCLNQGKFSDARAYFERALAVAEAALGNDHPRVAMTLNNLGLVLDYQNENAQAQVHYERALKIREQTFGMDDQRVAHVLVNLGALLEKRGELRRARRLLERALVIRENDDTVAADRLGETQFALAKVLWRQRDRGRALELARAAVNNLQTSPLAGEAVREAEAWLAARTR
jgi:tetratricopeptide (TPR) repeat protein